VTVRESKGRAGLLKAESEGKNSGPFWNREDRNFFEGTYPGQVNGQIQQAYEARGGYQELSDPKYTDTSPIFDIMAITVESTVHSPQALVCPARHPVQNPASGIRTPSKLAFLSTYTG
jgi:hypothetical protein